MRLTIPPIDVQNGFDDDIDIFKRKQYGEALFDLITSTEDELVLALDGSWGEGKSTFVRMWQGWINEQNQVESIYFDAFENDYQADPFLAIASQLYSVTNKNVKFEKAITSAVKTIGRASLRIGARVLTSGFLGDSAFEQAGKASEEAADLADRLTHSNEDKSNIENFKACLKELAEQKGQIVFIIDELDRCKPKFSLAIIECIKHFFSVPNITFLLVMNREQMEESIRYEYGKKVDASKYLQKFITIWLSLPKIVQKNVTVQREYISHCLNHMHYTSNQEGESRTIEYFNDFANLYDLSLRGIERSLTNFAIIQNILSKRDPNWAGFNNEYLLMAIFLSTLRVIKPDVFSQISTNTITYDDLAEKASLRQLNGDGDEEKPHELNCLLRAYLGSEEERRDALKTLKDNNFMSYNIANLHTHNIKTMLKVCGWLNLLDSE